MYGNDKDKDTKLKSLKDLGSKMRELHAHSVKGDSASMHDDMPNGKSPHDEEDTEDKSEMSHQDREDSKHDDMNEDGMNEESNLESHPSHDSEAVHDHKPNPKMPKEHLKSHKEHSDMGDSEEVHDEHGGNAPSPHFGKYPHMEMGDESHAEDEEEDTDHLEPMQLHPGLQKLLQEHLMKK